MDIGCPWRQNELYVCELSIIHNLKRLENYPKPEGIALLFGHDGVHLKVQTTGQNQSDQEAFTPRKSVPVFLVLKIIQIIIRPPTHSTK